MQNFTMTSEDGIATFAFDTPGKPVNVISHDVIAELAEIAARLRSDEAIRGAIFTSAKPSGFGAGADLDEMLRDIARWQAAEGQERLRAGLAEAAALSTALRALETCGKPVAGIAHGVALGGAFEVLLACHFRVAVEDATLRMAFPEASVGLLPGAGGTQRAIRLAGIMRALPWLLDGKPITIAEALETQVLHASAPDMVSARAAARSWIRDGGDPAAPWDAKGFRLPGGGPHSPAGYTQFGPAIAARTSDRRPGIANMLRAIFEGAQVPIDAALRIESRYFFNTTRTAEASAQIEAFFASRRSRASA